MDFGTTEGIRRLEEAIAFAQPLEDVDTSGVEPMYTVLENESLRLRDDVVTEGNCREVLLANASLIEEDFFIAPPGNIPLKHQTIMDNVEFSPDKASPRLAPEQQISRNQR